MTSELCELGLGEVQNELLISVKPIYTKIINLDKLDLEPSDIPILRHFPSRLSSFKWVRLDNVFHDDPKWISRPARSRSSPV